MALQRWWKLLLFISICAVLYRILAFDIAPRKDHLSSSSDGHWCPNTSGIHAEAYVVTRFEPFFDNSEISRFRDDYIASCNNRTKQSPRIFGAVLEQGGFGSVLNNALNAYLIATEPNIDRQFRFYFGEWIYPALSNYFVDFSRDTPCPLFQPLSAVTDKTILANLPRFTVAYNSSTKLIDLNGGNHLALRYFVGDSWLQTRNTMNQFEGRDGAAALYRRKSALLKAVWNFKPEFYELLKLFWRKLIDESGSYIAMHIRRGDKISSKEMAPVPVEDYYRKLTNICDKVNCPKHVFLMTDDSKAFAEFSQLAVGFHVMNFSDVVMCAGERVEDFVVNLEGHRPNDILPKMGVHMHELIFSVTLMGMADHIVCTLSSNLCRLIALLKSDPEFKSLHSLDSAWSAL